MHQRGAGAQRPKPQNSWCVGLAAALRQKHPLPEGEEREGEEDGVEKEVEGEIGHGCGTEAAAGDFETAEPRGGERSAEEEEQGGQQDGSSALQGAEKEGSSREDF